MYESRGNEGKVSRTYCEVGRVFGGRFFGVASVVLEGCALYLGIRLKQNKQPDAFSDNEQRAAVEQHESKGGKLLVD